LGHIPLIDANPRRDQARKQELLDEQRRRKLLNHSSAEDIRIVADFAYGTQFPDDATYEILQ
jgi:hypothetical protein